MNSTRDIYTVAFLEVVKSIKFDDFKIINERQAEYTYNISDEAWHRLSIEFYSSDVKRVKNVHASLRGILKDGKVKS